MNQFDIMAKVLAEVMGKPEAEARQKLAMLVHSRPSPRMKEEMPDDEAEKLFARLRSEKAGIRSWLLAGARKAAADPRRVRKVEDNWNSRH